MDAPPEKKKNEKLDWKETITPSTTFMRIAGVWPSGDNHWGLNLYTLYSALVLSLCQGGLIIPELINLYFIRNDLKALTGTIYLLLSKIGSFLKTYCLVRNIKLLKPLLKTANNDIFQPRNTTQRKLIDPNIRAYRNVASSFLIFVFPTLFFWCSFPILDKTSKNYRLPFLAWYPFNTKTSPQYEMTYIFQSVSINMLAMANCNIDLLIAGLNMFIGAQYDMLCDNLRNLCKTEDGKESVSEKLRLCIEHHKELIKFANRTNDFYNWLLFVQFFVGAISIGISMFQLTIVVSMSNEFIMLVLYANAVLVEVFMYCWFGNEIAVKSNKVSYSVFESDWTGFSPEVKKSMIIFVLRVQNPLKISAFGLFYLSVETFVSILRTSYSYFTLLRQVNQPTQ